jgi:hypothetical protein
MDLAERIENIEEKIIAIDIKLEKLLKLVENDCKKMTNHIDFVENVYEKVKSPFAFIMNSVNNIIPGQTQRSIELGSVLSLEDERNK